MTASSKKIKKVSILIPCYNEAETILELLEKVKKVEISGFEKEIIVIDDGSQDISVEILKAQKNIKLILNSQNRGKGYAIRKGIKVSTGNIILIQDADLEYNPLTIGAIPGKRWANFIAPKTK